MPVTGHGGGGRSCVDRRMAHWCRLWRWATAGSMKSVLNLRSDTEAGTLGMGILAKERALVESLGLVYANVSIPHSPVRRAAS